MSAAAYIAGLQRPQVARRSTTRSSCPTRKTSRMFLPPPAQPSTDDFPVAGLSRGRKFFGTRSRPLWRKMFFV
jgi:hypothetical protein